MKKSITYYLFVQSGSIHEKQKPSGIAHLLEHLVFRYYFQDKDLQDFIEKKGGDVFASTRGYDTCCKIKGLTSENAPEIRKKIRSFLKDLKISKKAFKREKRVVMEEIAYTNQKLYKIGASELDKLIFKDTPFENPPLGTVESLKRIKFEDVLFWYEKFYKKGNFFEFFYNKQDNNFKILSDNIKEPLALTLENKAEKKKVVKKGFNSKIIELGWLFKKPTIKEVLSLDVLREMLSGASTSFIYKNLKQDKNLIYSGGFYVEHWKDLSFLEACIFSTQSEEVIKEIKKLKNNSSKFLSEEIFEKSKKREIEYLKDPSETYKAQKTGERFLSTGKLLLPKERIEKIKRLTFQDLKDCAKKVFAQDYFFVLVD